jgi:hypothetical protein
VLGGSLVSYTTVDCMPDKGGRSRETKEIHPPARTHFYHSQVTRRRDDDACRLRGTRGTRKKKKTNRNEHRRRA